MNSALSMGNYAFYVWGAYSISLSVLLLNVIWARVKRRSILKQLKRHFIRLKK